MKKLIIFAVAILVCFGIYFVVFKGNNGKEAFQDKTYFTKVGNVFFIKVASNPSTGASWELNKPLDTILLLQGSDYIPKKTSPKVVGAGGEEIWTFQAIKAGTTTISLKYGRSWEKDKPPAKIYNFPVEIKD
ncbi:MAG: protease inhibitor I42 family protein [Candidatus Margulisiibacteriota bacterium]|jgi:predicted secreted protein